jgi:hypothetical protein
LASTTSPYSNLGVLQGFEPPTSATNSVSLPLSHISCGNAECIVQWRRFRDLIEATGYSPFGEYLLCIAPTAAGVTNKTTTIKKTPTLLAILMAMAMRR